MPPWKARPTTAGGLCGALGGRQGAGPRTASGLGPKGLRSECGALFGAAHRVTRSLSPIPSS